MEKLTVNGASEGILGHYISLATLLSKNDKRMDLAVEAFTLVKICVRVTGMGLSKLEVRVWFNFQIKKRNDMPQPLATRNQAVSSSWSILPAPKMLFNKLIVGEDS